ncbi:MAG TPA: uroporphyrinogen-III synthase, partial [Solirubrobacteraceae bacterium]
AGIAASAYAGVPVTHRGLSTAVALVTGHTQAGTDGTPDGEQAAIDWQALAAFPGTLVLYMGVRQLPHITASLIAAGRPGSQPAAVVQDGTLPTQRTVQGTLETIAEIVREQNVRPPSITIIGPVAALAEEIAWLTPRPLRGLSVAVTRARAQASGLAHKLQALGANVVQAPVIRVQPLSDPAQPTLDPSPYDLICLASPNAVSALFERLDDGVHPLGDARGLAAAKIAAIGPGTARALAEHGVVADVVPERFVAESLVEALAEIPVERVLIARAREARDVLADALRARGAEVDVVALYETVAEPLSEQALQAVKATDYITFTSSSTVRFFLRASSGADALLAPDTRIVSIGPVTSETLREHGLEPHVEAHPYDIEGMIAALLADVATQVSDGR